MYIEIKTEDFHCQQCGARYRKIIPETHQSYRDRYEELLKDRTSLLKRINELENLIYLRNISR